MIIFLYGKDSFSSRQKLNKLKDKFLREVDPAGNSLATIDGKAATMAKINEAIGASSLFARKRMIVIERMFANKSQTAMDQVCEYLTNKQEERTSVAADDNIIIFWDDVTGEKMGKNKLFKFLNKEKYAQNFKLLSNTEATNWVKKETEARGVKIRNKAAYTLISMLGSDLWQISNEIDKLISYKLGSAFAHVKFPLFDSSSPNPDNARKTDSIKALADKHVSREEPAIIEEEDIERLVRGNFDENIFALTDAISNKNKAVALRLFEQEIEAGVTESYLMHMIVRQFRILLQVRQAVDNGYSSRKITSELKLHPFVVQKSLSQARKFSLEILKKIFRGLVQVDYEIKSGRADTKTALSLLIARI